MSASSTKGRWPRSALRRRIQREARQELDFLRGAVLDGSFRRDYPHIGLSKADFCRRFLRFKKHIRGTAQWKRAGPYMPERWSPSDVLAPFGPANRKQLEVWIEGVALEEDEPIRGQEHLLSPDEMFRVFKLLNDTYYMVLDFLLLPHYVEICVGPLIRVTKSERKRRSGFIASLQRHGADDEDEKKLISSLLADYSEYLAELEHQHLTETACLAAAVAEGMIGGLSRGSKRLYRGPDEIKEVEKRHTLPCFRSLLRTLDTLFADKGNGATERDAYLDGLLVHYFGPWYFTDEDPRRVHNQLSSWRRRKKTKDK